MAAPAQHQCTDDALCNTLHKKCDQAPPAQQWQTTFPPLTRQFNPALISQYACVYYLQLCLSHPFMCCAPHWSQNAHTQGLHIWMKFPRPSLESPVEDAILFCRTQSDQTQAPEKLQNQKMQRAIPLLSPDLCR